jgi:hypothetical protein
MGVGDRSSSAAHVDDLVEEGKGVVGLHASGHDLPQVPNLPVGGRLISLGDEGLRDFDHLGQRVLCLCLLMLVLIAGAGLVNSCPIIYTVHGRALVDDLQQIGDGEEAKRAKFVC